MSKSYKGSNSYTKSLLLTALVFPVTLTAIQSETSNGAHGDPHCNNKWSPKLTLDALAGNKHQRGIVSAFAPIYQRSDSMLFVHLNFMMDNRRNQEGNFGLGYRWINDDASAIWGIYGYYDRRSTKMGGRFNQATLGLERLSDTWDVRSNVYIPQSKKQIDKGEQNKTPEEAAKLLTADEAGLVFKGHNRVTSLNAEVALPGFDFEIGRSIPGMTDLRLHLGGFYFAGRDGAKAIQGAQTRATYKVNDYLSFEAGASYDKVRKTNVYGGVKLSVKLGFNAKDKRNLTSLEKRMEDLPVRDKDIIIGKTTKETTEAGHFHVKKADPKNPIPKDAKKGDGTVENPFVEGTKEHKNFIKRLLDETLKNLVDSLSSPNKDESNAIKVVHVHYTVKKSGIRISTVTPSQYLDSTPNTSRGVTAGKKAWVASVKDPTKDPRHMARLADFAGLDRTALDTLDDTKVDITDTKAEIATIDKALKNATTDARTVKDLEARKSHYSQELSKLETKHAKLQGFIKEVDTKWREQRKAAYEAYQTGRASQKDTEALINKLKKVQFMGDSKSGLHHLKLKIQRDGLDFITLQSTLDVNTKVDTTVFEKAGATYGKTLVEFSKTPEIIKYAHMTAEYNKAIQSDPHHKKYVDIIAKEDNVSSHAVVQHFFNDVVGELYDTIHDARVTDRHAIEKAKEVANAYLTMIKTEVEAIQKPKDPRGTPGGTPGRGRSGSIDSTSSHGTSSGSSVTPPSSPRGSSTPLPKAPEPRTEAQKPERRPTEPRTEFSGTDARMPRGEGRGGRTRTPHHNRHDFPGAPQFGFGTAQPDARDASREAPRSRSERTDIEPDHYLHTSELDARDIRDLREVYRDEETYSLPLNYIGGGVRDDRADPRSAYTIDGQDISEMPLNEWARRFSEGTVRMENLPPQVMERAREAGLEGLLPEVISGIQNGTLQVADLEGMLTEILSERPENAGRETISSRQPVSSMRSIPGFGFGGAYVPSQIGKPVSDKPIKGILKKVESHTEDDTRGRLLTSTSPYETGRRSAIQSRTVNTRTIGLSLSRQPEGETAAPANSRTVGGERWRSRLLESFGSLSASAAPLTSGRLAPQSSTTPTPMLSTRLESAGSERTVGVSGEDTRGEETKTEGLGGGRINATASTTPVDTTPVVSTPLASADGERTEGLGGEDTRVEETKTDGGGRSTTHVVAASASDARTGAEVLPRDTTTIPVVSIPLASADGERTEDLGGEDRRVEGTETDGGGRSTTPVVSTPLALPGGERTLVEDSPEGTASEGEGLENMNPSDSSRAASRIAPRGRGDVADRRDADTNPSALSTRQVQSEGSNPRTFTFGLGSSRGDRSYDQSRLYSGPRHTDTAYPTVGGRGGRGRGDAATGVSGRFSGRGARNTDLYTPTFGGSIDLTPLNRLSAVPTTFRTAMATQKFGGRPLVGLNDGSDDDVEGGNSFSRQIDRRVDDSLALSFTADPRRSDDEAGSQQDYSDDAHDDAGEEY